MPGADPPGRLEAARPHRGRPGRHVPGPLRAGGLRRGPGQPPHPARPGQAALVFGRIDRAGEDGTAGRAGAEGTAVESYHIGRLAVADEEREPVVIDWRAPVAEPFYRATGRDPMGLARRRHFATKGRQVLAIEDELFGEGHLGVTGERRPVGLLDPAGRAGDPTHGPARRHRRHHPGPAGRDHPFCRSRASSWCRAGRAPARRSWRCTGPPTSSTRTGSRLEDQGVLVVGPNRVFLRYIDQVLPSLGEAGVELVVLADLVPDVELGAADSRQAARVKGDARMARVLAKAVHDRERPLREDLVVPYGVTTLRLTVAGSDRIVKAARRRFRRHNAARRFVETEVFTALAASSHIETTRGRGAGPHPPPRRGAGGARTHVAGAHPGRAAARPVRLPGPVAPGGVEVAGRRGMVALHRAAPRQRPAGGLVGARRRPARRGPRAAGSPGQPQHQRRARPRSGPTATSSWTRCRTSRPCSCGWWPAGRSTAR